MARLYDMQVDMEEHVMFIDECPIDQDEIAFADEFVTQTLSDWVDAGNSPSALLNSMVKIINEITKDVAIPMQ